MDNQARLKAALEGLSTAELRLMELFVEWLAAGTPAAKHNS